MDPIVVSVSGEIDISCADDVFEMLTSTGSVWVEANCRGLEFIDAAGIEAFCRADSALKEAGGGLILSDPSRALCKLLDICGLVDGFRKVESA